MQIQPFFKNLPMLYLNWGTSTMMTPINSFQKILDQVEQPTTANFLQLLVSATEYLEAEETIFEIGCLSGANLIGMLAPSANRLAYAVEFYSTEEDIVGEKIEILQANLAKFNVLEQVCFAHQKIDDFFCDLISSSSPDHFGLCIYSFEPDYRQVLMSLLLACNFFSDQALIIVRNTNEAPVRQAIADFLTTQTNAKILLDWQSISNSVFGCQGIGIIAWDRQNLLIDFQPMIIQETLVVDSVTSSSNTREIIYTAPRERQKKQVLHVGCGPYNPEILPIELRSESWQEIRMDINPEVQPDILGTITDLGGVEDNSVDAVYSAHNLEHIYDYEVPVALAEFKRVLKSGGMVWLVVPDMQIAAEWVVRGDMDEDPLYMSSAGPVKAIWMFYGMGTTHPGMPYMAHKTGFTASGLKRRLLEVGFTDVEVTRNLDRFEVWAKAYKKS